MTLVIELVPLPLTKRRRITAQVDRDVPDPAAQAAHQLRLARVGLKMKATQRSAPGGAGMVLLNEIELDAKLGPYVAPVGLEQEPALVTMYLGLNQHDAVDLGVDLLRHLRGPMAARQLRGVATIGGPEGSQYRLGPPLLSRVSARIRAAPPTETEPVPSPATIGADVRALT